MQSFFVKRGFSKAASKIHAHGELFDKRVFLVNDNEEKLSFWNDIPLKSEDKKHSNVFNATFEIPRYTISKMELRKEEKHHPIYQDTRKNKKDSNVVELRYYAQFGLFNYGFLPQTWENSLIHNEKLGNLAGDDDPLDIIEISDRIFSTGSTVPVKVFGSLCLVDQGELDWKIISLNVDDAEEKKIKNLDDLEKAYPARMDAIRHWFKMVKTYDGKKENTFHFEGKAQSLESTLEIIEENHKSWEELKNIGKTKKAETEYEQKLLEKAQKFHFCD